MPNTIKARVAEDIELEYFPAENLNTSLFKTFTAGEIISGEVIDVTTDDDGKFTSIKMENGDILPGIQFEVEEFFEIL